MGLGLGLCGFKASGFRVYVGLGSPDLAGSRHHAQLREPQPLTDGLGGDRRPSKGALGLGLTSLPFVAYN